MKMPTLILPLLALALTGCAEYHIRPVRPAEVAAVKDGYIFYQPELYFAVTRTVDKDKQESITVAPLYLPNYQKPYRVTTFNFLAKSDFGFNFENGWKLTSISDRADNSAVADTLAGQLKAALSGGRTPKLSADEPAVLYHAEFDDKGVFNRFTPVNIGLK
jgi:hypothetical protein